MAAAGNAAFERRSQSWIIVECTQTPPHQHVMSLTCHVIPVAGTERICDSVKSWTNVRVANPLRPVIPPRMSFVVDFDASRRVLEARLELLPS